MPTEIKHQILEELIYDRIRTRLAIRELREVDADLRLNIKETLLGISDDEEERDSVAFRLLERAWRRLGKEANAEPSAELSAAVAAA